MIKGATTHSHPLSFPLSLSLSEWVANAIPNGCSAPRSMVEKEREEGVRVVVM